MEDYIVQLLSLAISSGYAFYVFLWCAFCGLFSAFAPPSVTQKIPNLIMMVINVSSLNIGRAANALTDIKGNPRNGSIKSDSKGG